MTGKRLPFQNPPRLTRLGEIAKGTIPAIVGEAAWQGYELRFPGLQSCARIHERGGFDMAEIGLFIALAVDAGLVEIRLTDKAKPT